MAARAARFGNGWLPVLVVVALYVASRVWLLGAGYGVDDDAWLTASAADAIASEGRYVPSRLPGFPTVELSLAAAFRFFGPGYVTGNAVAAAVGLAGVLIFVVLAWRLGLPFRHRAALALALQPAFWISSVTTLDSIWSVTLTLAVLERLVAGSTVVAGVLLGIAAGARMTNVVLVVPVIAWLWMTKRRLMPIVSLVAAAGATTLALFAPLLWAHGLGFLKLSSPVRLDYLSGLYWLFLRLFGLPFAVIAAIAVLAYCRRGAARAPLSGARLPESVLLVGSMAALFLQWFSVPYDPFHLLAWVPLVLLLVLRWAPPPAAHALMAAWVVPAFLGIALLDVKAFRARHALQVDIVGPGQILADHREREHLIETARLLSRTPIPAGSCVIVGPSLWAFQTESGIAPRQWRPRFTRPQDDVLFLRTFRPEWQADVVGKRQVLYVAGADLPYLTERIFGTSLASLGARELALPSGTTASAP